VVVGCLRLSHKYGVDYLRRRALIHFSSGFPSALSEWNKTTYSGDDWDPTRGASGLISWRWPGASGTQFAAIIQLAREVDSPWILPGVFYALATW
ncbi:hypothetical protein B0H13DRAFT_1477969, partial [Mycena leptocephala]